MTNEEMLYQDGETEIPKQYKETVENLILDINDSAVLLMDIIGEVSGKRVKYTSPNGIIVTIEKICPICGGEGTVILQGSVEPKPCPDCKGTGKVL